ncbi:MAG: outer membrane beta-barrel protein [Cyclobacteriaceae bacterium]
MKKLLLFSFLCLSIPALGQYGVRVGPSLSTFRTDDADQGYMLGYRFGSYLEVASITDKLIFSPEVYMSLLGSDGPEDNEISLLYLQVPMMLRYYLQSRNNGFYLESGAGLGYLLSAEDEAAATGDDAEDDYQNFEYYVPLGIGYHGGDWGLTATYHLGLRDIADTEGASVHNSSFSILVTLPLFNGRLN